MALTYDPTDTPLVVLLSSSASLDASPKKNWVENSGGLPPYVRKIARGVMKSGKSKSMAISIAIGQIKRWAAGGGEVDADTRAKAAKALAQWEALKAKNRTKQLVKATSPQGDYLFFAAEGSEAFDTDLVRGAWDAFQRHAREVFRKAHEAGESKQKEASESFGGFDRPVLATPGGDEGFPYFYIKSLWSEFLIVQNENTKALLKIPFEVEDGEVEFGQPMAVKEAYVPVEDEDGEDEDPNEDFDMLSENEMELLGDLIGGGF